MKTAISIPNRLYQKAEKAAKILGLTRSALYCIAIQEFLDNHIHKEVTENLNKIYFDKSVSIDKDILSAQLKTIKKEKW